MFSSLRARLWLSYLLIILVMTGVIAGGLILAFYQNPRLLYPNVVFHLRLAGDLLTDPLERALNVSEKDADALLQRESLQRSVRLALVDANHKVRFDTGGAALPLARIARNARLNTPGPDQIRLVRGQDRKLWLYLVRFLSNGDILLVISPAPALPLATLIRDQFFSTFFYAGIGTLVLAFILAFALGRWITAPLRPMISAAQAVARGENPSVPVRGPAEVQELAQAFNTMSRQVQDSQQALRAKEQTQRDFVANVSHELKTPVTSIQGFAQAILDGAAQTPEALRQSASVIYNEAARMNRLVMDLLSLARLESGTADLLSEPVNLRALLENVIEKFTPQANQAQVSLIGDLAEIPTVTGDGDRLAQVFTNLIDNAIKFTPPGGRITVTARMEDGAALISVADTGKGISPEDQPRIFDRFYQADKSRRGGAGRGFGLGLPIARQIVLAHGGEIWVESQPAQGSRFVVKIPLTQKNPFNRDSSQPYSFMSKR